MSSDEEIVVRNLDLQQRGKDVPLIELPDSMSMFLLPEDIARVTEADFEELLEAVRDEIGE